VPAQQRENRNRIDTADAGDGVFAVGGKNRVLFARRERRTDLRALLA
jgi:hypothetical protein